MRKNLTQNSNDLLDNAITLEGRIRQNFADNQQNQCNNRSSFHF